MSDEKDIFLKGQIARDFDFYRIREAVSKYAASEEGSELLLDRESTSDIEKVERLKNLGRQWCVYLDSKFPQALRAWPPVKEIFSVLGIQGAALSHEQIFALGLFCTYTEQAAELIKAASFELDIPDIADLAGKMPSLQDAKNAILSVIDISTGEIKDIPVLREIRKKIASLHKEIESSLRKYTSDPALNSVLQSNVPALRADKELLAVRSDHRNVIKGIIHEVSPSGQTLYIEPEEIVRVGNELVQEEFRLQSEINKIFKMLSEQLGKYNDDFIFCHDTMLLLDVTCAAAKYKKAVNGVFAENCDSDESVPSIINARHPVLAEKAVPVSINFMPGKRVMIITGPNTGGKTVTLKTVALFSLMNQAGFPVSADEGTRLPVFNSVFADIGDEQSIDDSLSTFSSRMKKIGLALNNADSRSLVLLDEFGSGTDPLEGSAIAMATLDSLIERNSFVLVTTHHGVLKNYGYTNPKCINASVEFNSQTLSPTYKLLMGIPGESHAMDIALNSGLPEEIVEKARNYISTEQADVSALIKGLTEKHIELEEYIKSQKEKEEKLSLREFKIHSRETKMLRKEIELKEMEHSESTAFLRETRSRLENLVRILREGEITREKTLGVRAFISDLTEKIDSQETVIDECKAALEKEMDSLHKEEEIISENGIRISKSKDRKAASNKKTRQKISNAEALKNTSALIIPGQKNKSSEHRILLKEGIEVFVGIEKRKGILVKKLRDEIWQVQFGAIKMNVSQNQLVPIEKNSVPEKVSVKFETTSGNEIITDEAPKYELRLLGMRCEEAVRTLEHQLDLCVIHNFKNFSVIHGKGNGILQQAVHDYLSHYPNIKEFRFARPEEGGSGKTYVELF